MHRLSTLPSTIKDIFQLFSKFLSKMVETGILKTYTFLYSENYSYIEKSYGDVMNAIEDFKDFLLKICSELTASEKTICEPDTFSLLASSSISNCIPRNDESAFSNHTNEFDLYSGNAIHDTIEQNIQFMTSNNSTICNNLTQDITNNSNQICSNLGRDIEFTSSELPSDNLKQNGSTLNFVECDRISEHVGHAISFPSYKNDLNPSQTEVMLNVHESSRKPNNVSYPKSDAVKMNLESDISLNSMHQNCNDSLYNTLKEAISGDFLQSMKFPPADTHDRPLERSISFDEHVQYPQCESSLQQIDLDILNNTNERIDHALDRIFDDQFAEHDGLLESECWNVDINLPSADPIQSNIDLQADEFELSQCSQNMKKKSIESSLDDSMVTNFENSSTPTLEDSVSADIENSLHSMNTSIPANLNDSISSTLSSITQEKYTNDFDTEKYFCEHCGFICNTKLKLKIHLKRQHNVYMNNVNKCDQCGKLFRRRSVLRMHMRIHRDVKPFKCQCCWKTFCQKGTLDAHIQTHTGVYKFPCSMCSKRFTTQAKLNFHVESHEKPKWRCDICLKMFTTKQYLNVHIKSHNKPMRPPEKCFVCVKCNALFEKKSILLLHIKETHPDVTFVCYYDGCGRSFTTCKKLRNHLYKKHGASKSAKKKVPQKFECESCRISFVEKSSYYRHNLLAHCEKIDIENSFNCMHCDKRFTTEFGLEDHLEKLHSACHSKDMDYSCSICGSLFYEENALKEHMNIHSDFGTHLCSMCGSVFSQKSDYLVHQSVHNPKKQNSLSSKKYNCETCQKQFGSKMELKQHELDAHNIVPNMEELKPHCCSICDKRFTTRGKCNLHMETHSENRQYKCTKCNKRFFRRDLLKVHISTHNGYRAHVCQLCGLGFSQKSSLKTHEATHEPKKTFPCDQCAKIFHSKQALNYHLNTHEGNFKFVCDVCGKKFVRKCHYDLHVLCHSNERPFKCLKCSLTYKTSKHLRDHTKKAHQNDSNFSSLLDSIYTDDDTITQQSLLDEYIPSINSLDSELIFPKT